MLDLSEKACDRIWNELSIYGRIAFRESAKDQIKSYYWILVLCFPIYLVDYFFLDSSIWIYLGILQLLQVRKLIKLLLWYNDLPRMGRNPSYMDRKIAEFVLFLERGKSKNTWYYRLGFKLFGVKDEW